MGDEPEGRETEELGRALGLIGVAAACAVVTALLVVGAGSRVLEASAPDRPLVLTSTP